MKVLEELLLSAGAVAVCSDEGESQRGGSGHHARQEEGSGRGDEVEGHPPTTCSPPLPCLLCLSCPVLCHRRSNCLSVFSESSDGTKQACLSGRRRDRKCFSNNASREEGSMSKHHVFKKFFFFLPLLQNCLFPFVFVCFVFLKRAICSSCSILEEG